MFEEFLADTKGSKAERALYDPIKQEYALIEKAPNKDPIKATPNKAANGEMLKSS